MNKAIPIAGLVLLVVLGLSIGRRLSMPSETSPVAEPEAAQVTSRPLGDVLERLNSNLGDAELYDLERELESRSYAELEQAYTRRIAGDPHCVDGRRMLSVMLKMDAPATLALVLASLEGSNLTHEHARLFREWGKFAPHEALRYATELDGDAISSPLISSGVQDFLSEWASRDPRAALDVWLALPEPKLADPEAVASAAANIGYSAALDPTMREVALEMLLDQPSSDERAKAIGGAVAVWAHGAPFEQVASWFAEQELEGSEASTIAVGLAEGAVSQGIEGPAAADWLIKQIYANEESPDARGGHLYLFAGNWANSSMEDCSRWLVDLPPGREADGALGGLISAIEHNDPASGFQWATQITTDELRKMWCRQTWDKWRRHAPAATEAYLAGLSADESERLGIEQ